jgi:hypothetical protein
MRPSDETSTDLRIPKKSNAVVSFEATSSDCTRRKFLKDVGSRVLVYGIRSIYDEISSCPLPLGITPLVDPEPYTSTCQSIIGVFIICMCHRSFKLGR